MSSATENAILMDDEWAAVLAMGAAPSLLDGESVDPQVNDKPTQLAQGNSPSALQRQFSDQNSKNLSNDESLGRSKDKKNHDNDQKSHSRDRRRSRSRDRRSRRSRSRSRDRRSRRSRSRDRRSRRSRSRDRRSRRSRSRSRDRRSRRSRSRSWDRSKYRRPRFNPPRNRYLPPVKKTPWELFTIHKGTIKSIMPYGMFVHVRAHNKDGLVHLSNYSFEHETLNLEKGSTVWVKFEGSVEKEKGTKYNFSMKAVSQDGKMTDLDPSNSFIPNTKKNVRIDKQEPTGPAPELYAICTATIRNVVEYGAFANLDASANFWSGLIHGSQISNDDIEDARLSNLVEEGKKVWVKIVSKNEDKTGKIVLSLSMRLVDQSTGRDLDENNTNIVKEKGGATHKVNEKLMLEVNEFGGSRRVLRNAKAGSEYTILPEPVDEDIINSMGGRGVNGMDTPAVSAGRGKSATIPAWMSGKETTLNGKQNSKKAAKRAKKEAKRAKKREKKEKKRAKKKRRSRESSDSGPEMTLEEAMALVAKHGS